MAAKLKVTPIFIVYLSLNIKMLDLGVRQLNKVKVCTYYETMVIELENSVHSAVLLLLFKTIEHSFNELLLA